MTDATVVSLCRQYLETWEPGVLMLPRAGVLELTIINDDKNTHCALLPSNGDSQFLWLVNHSKGVAYLELDGPGYYWFESRTGNDAGRGLTGAIVVQEESARRAQHVSCALADEQRS